MKTLFFTLVALFVVALHVYFYKRFLRDPGLPRPLRRVGGAAVALLAVGTVVAPLLHRMGLAWSWLGLLVVLAAVALPLDAALLLVRPAWRWWTRRALGATASGLADPGRRVVLARALAAGSAAATAGLVGYGRWRAYQPPEVTELPVRLRGLPRGLDGFRLVQLTDLHLGGGTDRRFLEETVARVNALRPDLVAITGDLVDGSVERLAPAAAALRGFRARHGTWFVHGNHEYYSGVQEWEEALGRLGLRVLRNQTARVGQGEDSFDLVGVDDWRSGRYDLLGAVAGRAPDRPAVLLAHQPEDFERAVALGIGLQLSGHTHGGQFFPGTLLISAVHRYSAGRYAQGQGVLYVSRGTGFWGPAMRIGSPPEVVVATLTS